MKGINSFKSFISSIDFDFWIPISMPIGYSDLTDKELFYRFKVPL